jgi:hypothetical protein
MKITKLHLMPQILASIHRRLRRTINSTDVSANIRDESAEQLLEMVKKGSCDLTILRNRQDVLEEIKEGLRRP